jgi:hypothetical protein
MTRTTSVTVTTRTVVRTRSVKLLHLLHDLRPRTYSLEGHDPEYFHVRSPAPLEIRIFASGKVADERKMARGSMLAKSTLRHVGMPATGYTDSDGQAGGKLRVRKLGGEFMRLRGQT